MYSILFLEFGWLGFILHEDQVLIIYIIHVHICYVHAMGQALSDGSNLVTLTFTL